MRQAELDKKLNGIVKAVAKTRGWKFSRGFVFEHKNPLFFSLIFLANAKSKNLHHLFQYNWYEFDDLFWRIVQLPENAKRPLSFRACGAFTAPMTEVDSGDKQLPDLDADTIENGIVQIFEKTEVLRDQLSLTIRTLEDNLHFLRQNRAEHLEKHPGSVLTIYTQEVLSEILNKNRSEALRICEDRIAAQDWGGFGFGFDFGINTFFTAAKKWLLSH